MSWRLLEAVEDNDGGKVNLKPSPALRAILDPMLAAAGEGSLYIDSDMHNMQNAIDPGLNDMAVSGFVNPKYWSGNFTSETQVSGSDTYYWIHSGFWKRFKDIPAEFFAPWQTDSYYFGMGDPNDTSGSPGTPPYTTYTNEYEIEGHPGVMNPPFCWDISGCSCRTNAISYLDQPPISGAIGGPNYIVHDDGDPNYIPYRQTDSAAWHAFYIAVNEDQDLFAYISVDHATETIAQVDANDGYRLYIQTANLYHSNYDYQYFMSIETDPDPEPTTEYWTPISNIADSEGRATMLAMVKASELNGDDPVTTGTLSQIERIFSDPYESKAYLSAALMFYEQGDVEEKFMMSGNNYMNVTIDSKTSSYEFTYTLDFYLADDTLIYSHQYTVNHDDHYLGAIRKSDGTAARPSMIIKNLATYSWNTEADFNNEKDEALYSWFIGTGGNPNPFADDELPDEQQGGIDYYPVPTDNDIGASTDLRPNDNRTNTGFFNAYVMGDQDLYELAEDLWTDSFWEDLKEYYATPADAIMALFELPFDTGYHQGIASRTAIKIGNKTSRATAIPITDSYATFEMGEIEVKPESDSYIDFKNYTKFYLYMPFVGVQEIDANLLMVKFGNDSNNNTKIVGKGSILRLQYTVDVLTGLLVAKVFINEILRYQWVGDCHSQLPYSWQTHQAATSQTISTIVSGIGAALATGAAFISGGAAIPVAAAAGLNFSKDIVKLAVAKSAGGSITSSGAIGQLAGALSYPYPYLMRVWPNTIYSKNQEHFIGHAQPHTQKVGDHPGYIRFADVHLDDIPCTDAEREEIASILRGGVIV